MKVTKTIKLHLPSLPKEALEVLEVGRDATNYAIQRAQETGKTSLGGLKKLIYAEVKAKLNGLHSHYAHSAIKWATEIYRSFRKRKRRGQIRGNGIPQLSRRAFRFEACLTRLRWQSPILTLSVITRPHQCLTFTVKVSSTYQRELLDAWQAGKLKLGEITIREESLHLPLSKEVSPLPTKSFLGVDVNESSLDWALTEGKAEKIGLKPVNRIFARHEEVVERSTQGKQNPAFKSKVIKRQKGRARRRTEHYLHIAAWRVVRKALETRSTIVLENLKHIKQRIRWNRRRLYNGWAARKLQRLITEKALWLGIPVVAVNPENTSKLCPVCGQVSLRGAERRVHCACGYEGDRDITAAWNIAFRAATGSSVAPECRASDETVEGRKSKSLKTLDFRLLDFGLFHLRPELLRQRRWRIEANQAISAQILPKEKRIQVKGILTKSRIPGIDYSLNPYVGCGFGCTYCYASFMKRFTDHKEPWGEFVDVKINAPELLYKQLQRAKPGHIVMSLVTDPYQPIEKKYQITRRCLEVFLKLQPHLDGFTLSILTRSALVLRDVDLLEQFKNLEVGLSITTDNDSVRKIFEPRAHSIPSRIETLRRLKAAGIKTYAFVGPMLPMNPEKLARSLAGTVDHVLMDRMNYTWKTQRLYKKHGLEFALEPGYFAWARRELERFFRQSGIPAEYVGK